VYAPVLVNEGDGPATQGVFGVVVELALQLDVLEQFVVVVVLVLKPGTSVERTTMISRNGRSKYVLSLNSVRYGEQYRENIAGPVNVQRNAAALTICYFSPP